MRRIEHLKMSFGDKTLFSDLSYRFPEFGCVRIAGKSGSGKTTLLRILLGLQKPSEGSVEGFFGECAAVFQEYRLFPALSALQNVTEPNLGKITEEDEERAKALLASLGFSEKEMKMKPAELSGGMKQRVNLARGFFSEKPVLILDEPIKELDPALAKFVRERIAKEAERRLVLLVSHNPEDAETFSKSTIAIEQ